MSEEIKVLITGGTGFIGSRLAALFLERGIETVLLDAFVRYFSVLEDDAELHQFYLRQRLQPLMERVEVVRGDTRDKDFMRRVINRYRPTHIVHLAALPLAKLATSYSEEATSSILTSTLNLLEIIRDVDFVRRLVYTSSSMVYGHFQYVPADEEHPKHPINIYGGAKLCGEVMVQVYGRMFGIEYTIVRPSAVYGPTDINQRVSQIFVENALRGRPLVLRGGDQTVVDFTYIDDVAEGFYLATTRPEGANQVFNITRGEGRSLTEFVEILRRFVPEIEVRVEEFDQDIPKRGALDISKARELLGYRPRYSLEEGLERYVDYVRSCLERQR